MPASAEVRAQLRKILESPEFSGSARIARFLTFVVEETLRGQSERLKEAVIGVQVFDREPSYDPRLDPIVRVEARRLRAKLERYYESHGRADSLRIELPKGTYSPAFRQPGAEPPPAATIAVLPFVNLSADPASDYFSDGLTEELIHALTRVDGLRVVASQSASHFRAQQEELDRIRERLKVAYVLRGSVRATGDRLRISAQLIQTGSGVYLWSETYDRQLRDVFAIQEQIASAIARALKLTLLGTNLEAAKPYNLDYYQLYLKGRFHWKSRRYEGLKRSIEYFDQAVALEPDCALAYAGLADSYTLLADYGLVTAAEVMPRAKAAAERALEIDPLSAEACTSLAMIRSHWEWRWPDAERLYRRAIATNPAYSSAHHWYAMDYLTMTRRFAEAQTELSLCLELDPLSGIVQEGQGFLWTMTGQFDKAVDWFLRMIQCEAPFYKAYTSLGRVYAQMGDYVRAIEAYQEGRRVAGDFPSVLGALAQAYGLAGHPVEARKVLAQLEAMSQARYVPATCFAIGHIGLGEYGIALDWLERGAEGHELSLSALYVHPVYDPLRRNPRFEKLIHDIGFLP